MVQENAPATNTTSLYVTEIKETRSEVNDIQNNQTENSCQEGCRLQEINVPQDQLMIPEILTSALCRLKIAEGTFSGREVCPLSV